MRNLRLDAAKLARFRKRASLYIDEESVSPKSKPIFELLYLSRECQSFRALFVRASCVVTVRFKRTKSTQFNVEVKTRVVIIRTILES